MALLQLQVNIDSLLRAMSDGMARTNQRIQAITTQQEEDKAL